MQPIPNVQPEKSVQMSCWSTLNMMEVMKRKICYKIYMIDDDNKSMVTMMVKMMMTKVKVVSHCIGL